MSELIPESVHLHYEIGKHVVGEKYNELKVRSGEIMEQCGKKWDVFKGKIGVMREELPSDASEIKEKLSEGLSSLKNKWKKFWK